jgi:hypothetical protein
MAIKFVDVPPDEPQNARKKVLETAPPKAVSGANLPPEDEPSDHPPDDAKDLLGKVQGTRPAGSSFGRAKKPRKQ